MSALFFSAFDAVVPPAAGLQAAVYFVRHAVDHHFIIPCKSTGISVFLTVFRDCPMRPFPVNYEYYRKKTKVVAVVTIISALVNIGLNWVLIRKIGMAGAALATVLSHGLQLAMHYGYNRFVLGKGEYPFGFRLWGKYAAGFAAMVVFVYATEGLWLVRWGVGACIGVWELARIKKRKVLI